jgi:hypothetical protein
VVVNSEVGGLAQGSESDGVKPEEAWRAVDGEDGSQNFLTTLEKMPLKWMFR